MAHAKQKVELIVLAVTKLNLLAGNFNLKAIDLTVAKGEYFVLMGATGSGKSLLVKSICGIGRINSGAIHIAGKRVDHLEPRFRKVGYVPQESNLFPHMSVMDNIIFPLRVRKISKTLARTKVNEIIDMLGLRHLINRSPISLSGGERQKTALARALATTPNLLILDEPVSAVDEPTRREICKDLRRVQRKFNLATIHVCHSLEEAQSVSDRAGIMHSGEIVQTGTLADISAKPNCPEVARLLNIK